MSKTNIGQKKAGYTIDFATSTFTMNYTFAKASEVVGSWEYRIVKRAKEDFPDLTVVVKAGREITTPRKTRRLTYPNMEIYIREQEQSAELLKIFERIKAESKASKSPYKFVRDWFEEQFPNYNKATLFLIKDDKATASAGLSLKNAG